MITCTICGFSFDPTQHPSCGSCPLHEGCTMACCPNCGTTNINPAGSRLATWLAARLQKFSPGDKKHAEPAFHPTDIQ